MAAALVSTPSLGNSKLTFQQMRDKFFQSLDSLQSMESLDAMRSRKILSWEVGVIISSVKLFLGAVYPSGPLDALEKGPNPYLQHVTNLNDKYPSQLKLIDRVKQAFSNCWAQLEISKSTWTPENDWVKTTLHWVPEKGFVPVEPEHKT